ncbi:hypothetical protein AB0M02_25105 [Actinoplanes sp. NPDC051861]|uniref:hypothetical protein n=1 Tax=Actinoplanes sp. NPDC051861 TaxID=3155170 RepID=UPI00342AFE23
MTHLEDLKDAMHSPPDFEPVPVDLAIVMAGGARMRRRRRFAVVSASTLAVAALLAGGSQLAGPGGSYAGTPVAGPSMPVPSTGNSSAPGVLGAVVETGQRLDGRQWILYVETTDPDDLDKTFSLVLGHTRSGTIDDFTAEIVSSDSGSGRMAPGFHAVRAGRVQQGRTTPTFGYYVGDAARITARDAANGEIVEARRSAWTGFGKSDKAQIFWFDFAQGRPPAELTDLTAYAKDGAELPAGR